MNSEEELELREYESRTQFLVERTTRKGGKKAQKQLEEGCINYSVNEIMEIQLRNLDYIRLLNKPYVNEVILTEQNPPLKCC